MTPGELLPVKPGDRVLDLCAAPGGKSTQLGARLLGEGLLVSNDISNSRARALLKNLELAGIPNICVTSESPERLSQVFPLFFDKILVDAPCSGEGMFRRDGEMVKDWALKRAGLLCAPAAGDFSRRRDHAAARGNYSVLHLHLLAGGGRGNRGVRVEPLPGPGA